MIKKLFCLIILLALTSNLKIYSQQGKVDTTFNTLDDGLNGDGFDKTVQTLNMQSDENLIVGGNFLSLNGTPLSYLTRLQPDGTTDQSFNTGTGFNGIIYTTYIQSDGKIIVGGSFTSYNGNATGRLIRLNPDGFRDTTFDTSIGASGIVYDIAQQADGKIVIVGGFAKYNNINQYRIARLMPNGALDASFTAGLGSTVNITNVKILQNQKILIGGNFTTFNGAVTNKLALLNQNGSVDTGFNIGTGFNGNVNAIAVQPDNKLIIGGAFTTYNEITANRIIRLNEDGTPDFSFVSGTGIDAGAVQVIKTDVYGNIMVGGSFTGSYNGSDINRVFFLNENGIINSDFDLGLGPGSASVLALEADSEGSWFIGGSFSVFDGINQGRLAKVNSEGEHDISYLSAGIGFDNSVLKVISLEDNKSMVFGNFSKFNGSFAPKIARLLNDGMLDPTFNSNKSGANKVIRTAVLQTEDSKIICGGDFTKYNDITCNRIVRILPDGAIDDSFNSGSGFVGSIYAIALQATGKIIVAGSISSFNGTTVSGRIVRLMPDGSRDTSFNVGSGADGVIESVLIQKDGKILIGGRFTKFNGITSPHLVRLNPNGDLDSGFLIGDEGFDKNVYSLALQSDQKIIVGGNFTTFNRTTQKRILRLNTNGTLDITFESGTGFSNGEVRSILVQPDDRILVGGTFSGNYKNNASLRLIRLLKTGSYDASFIAPLNNKLLTMSFTADHKLLIGGNFNSVAEISKHRIARLKLCLESTIWNGISWNNGGPSGGKEVVFKEDYNALTTTNICSCTIDQGKIVTLLSGNTLGIEFSYVGSGTLILEDGASLYQSDDDMVNTGIIHLKRKTKPVTRYDFTYWSSPVENQTLGNLSPNTLIDKYRSFNGITDSWVYEQPSAKMIVGRGYSIRAPQEFSITDRDIFEATFKGIPNNGKVDVNLGPADSFNFIGNPYPSALDADLFLIKNVSKTKGAIYLWTHNTPVTDHKYTADDYAVYNLLGGVGTSATSSGVNNTEPDGTIASGQSFFIQSKQVGTVQITNEMRIKGRNSAFFKPGKSSGYSKETAVEKHRIWLNFRNDEGIFKQILVGYIQGASNSLDENYDAENLNGNKFANFYSIVENKELVIQGRALPFAQTDSISLGYTTTIEGNYNFSIDHQDGIFDDFDIFIEDVALDKIHNLKESPYIFKSKEGTFNTRFLLKFTDKTLKVKGFDLVKENVFVAVKNKTIIINSINENINEVAIFDISGKMIYAKSKVGIAEVQVSNLKSPTQVLLVKVTLESGRQIAKKVVF